MRLLRLLPRDRGILPLLPDLLGLRGCCKWPAAAALQRAGTSSVSDHKEELKLSTSMLIARVVASLRHICYAVKIGNHSVRLGGCTLRASDWNRNRRSPLHYC